MSEKTPKNDFSHIYELMNQDTSSHDFPIYKITMEDLKTNIADDSNDSAFTSNGANENNTLVSELVKIDPKIEEEEDSLLDYDEEDSDLSDSDDELSSYEESDETDEKPEGVKKTRKRKIGKELKCTYEGCSESFRRPDRLQIHISSKHTFFYPYKCTHEGCPDAFASKHYLKKHLLRHEFAISRLSTPSPAPIPSVIPPRHKKCPSCPEHFLRKIQLRLHRFEAHEEALPFICLVCSKGFPAKYMLDKHTKNHNKLQRYPCEYPKCGFTACKWVELRKHLAAIHKANLQCTTCGKQYKRTSSLETHIEAKHSDTANQFVCDKPGCSKSYRLASSLRAHQRTGHGEISFTCSHCGHQFRYKHVMARHESKCQGVWPLIPTPKPQKAEKVKKKKEVVVEKLSKPKPNKLIAKKKSNNKKIKAPLSLIREGEFDDCDLAALERADLILQQPQSVATKSINSTAASGECVNDNVAQSSPEFSSTPDSSITSTSPAVSIDCPIAANNNNTLS